MTRQNSAISIAIHKGIFYQHTRLTMKSQAWLVSLLFIAGHTMGQGPQIMYSGRSGSFGRRNGIFGGGGGSVDVFNRNLQLDSVGFRRGGRTSSSGGSRGSFMGQGIQEDPDFVRRVLGSSVAGRELRMGEMGLPRHGGAGIGQRHADGMLNGWNGDPQTLTTQFQDSWSDPFRGRPVPQLPAGFNGDFSSFGGDFGSPHFGGQRQFWYITMKIICGVAVTMLFVMVSGQGGRLYTSNSNQAKSIATPFFGGQKQIKMIGIGGGPGKGFVDGYGQMYGGGFEKQYGSGYSMGYGSGYGMGYGSGYDMGYGGGYGMGFVGGYGPGYECLWSCRFRRVTHRIKVRK